MPAKYVEEDNGIDGAGSIYRSIRGGVQSPPYTKPLAYTNRHILTDYSRKVGMYVDYGQMAKASATKGNILIGPYSDETDSYYLPALADAQNKALAAFYGELDEQAMVAVNYAERATAARNMADRCKQLYQFGKAIRRFDLIGAASALELNPNRPIKSGPILNRWQRGKARAKDVGGAWLEYHFGWEPLVKDIFNAVKVLDSPMSAKTIDVRKSVKVKAELLQVVAGETIRRRGNGFAISKIGATLQIEDANLYLSNRLGLTNPAAVAWELVPYSFVVDWFTTIGEFINQWTDLQGVAIVDPWYSKTLVLECEYYKRYPPNSSSMDILSHGFINRRFLGLPSVTPKMRPLKKLSLVRAATAIALLLGVLPNK